MYISSYTNFVAFALTQAKIMAKSQQQKKSAFSPFHEKWSYPVLSLYGRMLERWKKALDKGKLAGALLNDLSKAFGCINHELLIAKLEAYGFDHESLIYVYSYLSDRKQRTIVNVSFSTWAEIIVGVPQGSILGPLLFNIT